MDSLMFTLKYITNYVVWTSVGVLTFTPTLSSRETFKCCLYTHRYVSLSQLLTMSVHA